MSTRPASSTADRPGRVAFVGAGPGDPGMLTARATAALAEAAQVHVDADVPTVLQDAVRELAPQAELVPVAGEPAEVAKAAVAATSRKPTHIGIGMMPSTAPATQISWKRVSKRANER